MMSPQAGVGVLKQTFKVWTGRRAFQHAAALSYFTLFSLAPLLIIIVAIAGAFFGEQTVRSEVTEQITGAMGPRAAEMVTQAMEQARIQESGLLPMILGIGALVFGATTVFGQMQSSLDQFWDVKPSPKQSGILVFLWTRLVSFGLVIIIGFLLLVSFAAQVALGAVMEFAQERLPIPPLVVTIVNLAVSLAVATLLFAMIFKVLPDVRLQWRDTWAGAVFTAVLFVLGQGLISLYLTRAAPASAYGAAGALVLVLLWVYYSALILFLGAAFVRAFVRSRGEIIAPKRTAVKVRTEVIEGDADRGGMAASGRE